MRLAALLCAALAAVVLLSPAPGTARVRSFLRSGPEGAGAAGAMPDSVMRGGVVRGGVVRNGVVRDSAARNGVVRNGVVRDSAARNGAVPGDWPPAGAPSEPVHHRRFPRPRATSGLATSGRGAAVPDGMPGGVPAGVPAGVLGGVLGGRQRDGATVSARSRVTAAVVAGAAVPVLAGGIAGTVLGLAAAVGSWYCLGRLEPAARRRERDRMVTMLPLVADLVTAALAAGCPPATAAETVGAAVRGPLGRTLADAAAAAGAGVEPSRAWSGLAAEPALRPLARAMTVAMSRGTSPSAALMRVAADARDAARWAGEARARSLGARAAAPLGLCFLPAFVLVGVVPIVATSGLLVP